MAERIIADAIRFVDPSRTGSLRPAEYKVGVIFLLGYKPTSREIETVFKDRSALNVGEFRELMRTRLECKETRDIARETFTAFDRHCKGFLSVEDGRRAFAEVRASRNNYLRAESGHYGTFPFYPGSQLLT